jgi:DNA-directed RNA polymerase subunit K/omega
MAGPLTWRDTVIPDFNTSVAAFRSGTDALRGAFQDGQDVVQDIQKQREDGTANLVLAELAKFQNNPEGLTKALESGEFQAKFDPRALTPEIMKTVMSKPAQLLEYAGNKRAFDQQQLEIDDSNYLRDNRDVFNQYLLAHRNGDAAAIADFEAKNGDVLRKASSTALKSFIQNGQEITEGDLRSRGTRLNQLITGTNFTDGQDDRKTGIAVEEMKAGLATLDPSQRLAAMNDPAAKAALTERYGARAVSRLIGELDGSFQMPSWMGALAGGGVEGGSTEGYDGFLVALESGGNPNAKAGTSSATGLHQFTGDTWLETVREAKPAWANGLSNEQLLAARKDPAKSTEMEKVFRAKNAASLQSAGIPLTNENLYAAHHFGAGGGVKFGKAAANTPMSQILTPDQIAANPYIKPGMTKADIVNNWYSRAGVANPRAAQIASGTITQANINQDPQTQLIRDFAAASQNNGDAEQLAASLVGKGGTLEGEDRGNASGLITRVADKYKLSPAEAAAVIARSTNGRDSWIRKPFSKLFGDGLDTYIDSDKVEQYAKFFKDRPALARKAVALDTQTQAVAQGAQANAQVTALQAARQQMLLSARARGGAVDTSFIDAAIAAASGNQQTAQVRNAAVATTGTPERPTPAAPKAAPPKKTPAAKVNENKAAKVTSAMDAVTEINRSLDGVRKAAATVKVAEEKGSPLAAWRRGNQLTAAITKTVNTAIASGLPQFKAKPGESGTQHRERVKELLKLY